MNDRPIGGTGGYNINWDEIDENTNPFGLEGAKITLNSPSGSVAPKLSENSDERPQPNHSVHSTDSKNSKEVAEATKVVDIKATDAKGETAKTEQFIKAPRPKPPARTVSNTNPTDSITKKTLELTIPDTVDNLPSDGVFSEERSAGGKFAHDDHSSRTSDGLAATFDLASGNSSILPEVELEAPPSIDEELASLRTDKKNLTTTVADMQRCIAEYEQSLRQLAEEKARVEESAKDSVIDIISERDQAIEEISAIEKAFGDLHRRFEKSKQIIEGFKTNEEALKKTAQEYQVQLKRQEQKYQALKAHAEQQLTKIAEETEKAKRGNEDEVTRLRAAIKRSELRIHSLESQLQQKIQENTELTKICDELLNKYGDKQ